MATAQTTWTFDDSTAYNAWTHTTTNGTQTRSYDSGNARAQIQSETGRNKTSDGHMSITGTFITLFGLSSGDTVTGYSAASFNGGCSAYNQMDAVYHGDLIVNGALEINDGTSRALINNQTSYTASGQTRSPTIDTTVSGLSLSASTSVTIYVHDDFDNANNASAGATIWVDNVSVTVDYTPAGTGPSDPGAFLQFLVG